MISKSTVSVVKVWKSTQGESLNIHIGELDVVLTISKNQNPKSYAEALQWLENDEPNPNPILFSSEE